jgi:fatty acid CoA ligase FadD32
MDYREDRAGVSRTFTWREVNARRLAVAERISELAGPSDRVAILCPQDLSYPIAFHAALAAGTIAVPLFAPEASSHAARLVGTLADCRPRVWLTTHAARSSVEALLEDPRVPRPAGVISVDAVDPAAGPEFAPAAPRLDAPAYLQYTSGSTRDPAGAVITHAAVAANAAQATVAYGLDESSTCVGWLPFFHDMGLVLLACMPAWLGARSVFSTPFDFVQRPRRWLDQLAANDNVITAAPNFAFDYAIDRTTPEDRAALDLSGVRAAINGAEPVRARTIARFQAAFGACGFAPAAHRPSYGLAEATVFVSTSPAGTAPRTTMFARAELMAGRAVPAPAEADAISLVSAGCPVEQHVAIVDPHDGALVGEHMVGEVWVHGPNLATGYWSPAGGSGSAFDARLRDGADGLPVGGWLRTGDLGVRYGGELYITGRLKDVIIVDGKNHYPQDIEETVQEAHEAVRGGRVAAFGIPVEEEGGEVIVVALERERGPAGAAALPRDIARAVRRAVSAAHDLKLADIDILEGRKVLRTSSGKVARAANRERYLAERGR